MKLECSYVQLPKIYRHLSGNELKVFVTMFDQWSMMKNEDGWYYRSQKQLCEDTGLTDRTLRDIIKKFVEKGVIFTTTYNDGVKMATYNKANEYKINMEKVVEMSKEKVVKKVKEGGNFYHPSNNKENKNKIYNINTSTGIHTSNYTPDEENKKYKTKNTNMKKSNSVMSHVDYIIQSDDVNNINSDELSNFNDVVMSGVEVEEDFLKFEENERSDNGTTAMSAISKGEAMLRDATNKMITSTFGDENNTTSTVFHNVPVVSPKDIIIPPATAPQTKNKATGKPQTEEMDNLSTQDNKTQPEPQECPQIEFNREEMLRLMDMSANETDLDRFKEQLRKMDEYMQWLKLNDKFQYRLYVKEIYCWFKSHTWNMELDFISLGGEFMRKYVA